ncbi:hypothetical protein PMNALOAF_2702 [Methylobacterium adhaesivum]|nr:hypothetical protein PMNALOAF_2702 [Methylobacterium adhaesivum]
MSSLDLTRERIRERLTKTGLSANDASRKAGLGLSYVNDLLTGKSKRPVPHRLAQLAEVLDCDVGYLLGTLDKARPHLKLVQSEPEATSSSTADFAIPIYNAGFPDADGFFKIDENSKVETVFTASRMLGPGVTYGIVVPDDSYAPRYYAGEQIFAHPNRSVSRGGFAVVRMKDGRATICRVVSLGETTVISRLADGQTREIPRAEIEGVHRVVGSVENF